MFAFCIILIILIRKDIISNYITNKFFITIVFSIFVLVIVLFWAVINSSAFRGCGCVVQSNHSSYALKSAKNKVIIIGDSRMSLINDNFSTYNIPDNYEFLAKSGAKIDWFVKGAIPELEDKLDNNSYKYRYHVVVNMGVNDMSHVDNPEKKALEYFAYYKSLALKYPSVKFYLLSVNPINKKIMEYRWSFMDINNSDINKFNDTLRKNAKDIHPLILYFCDSYDDIDFKTYDGLHYKHDTSQEIVDYIAKKCVKLK